MMSPPCAVCAVSPPAAPTRGAPDRPRRGCRPSRSGWGASAPSTRSAGGRMAHPDPCRTPRAGRALRPQAGSAPAAPGRFPGRAPPPAAQHDARSGCSPSARSRRTGLYHGVPQSSLARGHYRRADLEPVALPGRGPGDVQLGRGGLVPGRHLGERARGRRAQHGVVESSSQAEGAFTIPTAAASTRAWPSVGAAGKPGSCRPWVAGAAPTTMRWPKRSSRPSRRSG
jgi:hypothetical protein